ncbi:3-oxo-tetronate kinase [Acidisphaera sp. L21]|uniref:3-oxo-tetronate kinase n=1 Tax=Acidisphaera sp. L21 TaxID=1641851 RepID=UPI00131C8AD1|nr:3-oxo-tetronate kinase [Acidisphaera sp. L21]
MRSPILGAIADDFTGAVELAGVLAAGGARTLLFTGPQAVPPQLADTDAVVIALRSRVAPPDEAIATVQAAADAFEALGVQQIFFKYCATFDSTDSGNIGNCSEVLLARTGAPSALFCPGFPEAFRTIYQGHLFVADRLLQDSPKRFDPLTPMTRSRLSDVLAPQTTLAVGLLPWEVVQAGAAAIRSHVAGLAAAGTPFVIADTLTDGDLQAIAQASWDWRFTTGGSTVVGHYPAIWQEQGLIPRLVPPSPPRVAGAGAVLAGSCSDRTREQIAAFGQHHPVLELDVLANEAATVSHALDWATPRLADGPVCITTSTSADAVAAAQARMGAVAAGRFAEGLLGQIATGLVARGVRRLLVAGGETSGSIVQALGITELHVAPYTTAGLGVCLVEAPVRLALCLKSGKLGTVDMFARTLAEMGDAA